MNMLILYFSLPIFLFMIGVMVFVSYRKHLLSMLLSLEYMVLSLFLALCMYLFYFNNELYFSMVFLTFSVCEGALGLSILVSMVRTHGNDYFQSFSILQC
uniref:NADH-ubiquinone oxidoreductase chain 4L n=1 Tax=Hemipenthes neimengguensis TaxID=2783692 RepID=A0A7S6VJQ9_9MUSC|nr:NADH dehydrogenase subunit 4L [Hemipenthes neimengguensis]QOW39620.1 NADH dehydrogenase subunit 4L [Hemipenthes neimengguensis]